MTLKLLLAGKEIADFQVIKDAFDDEDAVIITATSMALSLFLARKNQPNLVIAQWNLTDSDGMSLFYELKNDDELREIPFTLFLPHIKDEKDRIAMSKNKHLKNGIYSEDIPVLLFADICPTPQNIFSLKEKIMALSSNI